MPTASDKQKHLKPEGVRVIDLSPGDIVERREQLFTFVMQGVHPTHPALQLVLWRRNLDGAYQLEPLPLTSIVGKLVKKSTKEQVEWGLGASVS